MASTVSCERRVDGVRWAAGLPGGVFLTEATAEVRDNLNAI